MIIVTDITILFSGQVSLIVPLQTWNVKYYKYAIIKNGLKSLFPAHLATANEHIILHIIGLILEHI